MLDARRSAWALTAASEAATVCSQRWAMAFFVLAGLLLTGTAAVAQRYGGAWWLWLAFLASGAFTAVLAVMRRRTCFGPAQKKRQQPTSSGPEDEADREGRAGEESQNATDRELPPALTR
jgi:hypothetical protein